MSAKNILRGVLEEFRINKVKLRLRQALKMSYKNIEAKSGFSSMKSFQNVLE